MYMTPDTPAPAARAGETPPTDALGANLGGQGPLLPAFLAAEHPSAAAEPRAVTPDDARRGKWAAVAPLDARLAMQYCELVALGHSAREIRDLLPHPDAGTFMIWVAQHPELAIAYRASRELSSYAMEDEALALARRAVREDRTATKLRAEETLIGQLRWSAVKRNPGVFSEKAAVQLVVPIQINTTLDLGGAPDTMGNADFPNIYDMQAEVLRDTPTADIPDEHIYGVQPGDLGSAQGGQGQGTAGPADRGPSAEEEEGLPREAPAAQPAGGARARRSRKAPTPAQEAAEAQARPEAAAARAGEAETEVTGFQTYPDGADEPGGRGKASRREARLGPRAPRRAPRGSAVVDATPEGSQEGRSK